MMMMPQLSLKKALVKTHLFSAPVSAAMPFPIYYGASTVRFGNSFLLVGGEGPNGASGTIRRWDEATSTLQPVGAAMRTPRGGAAAVLIEAAAFPSCN